MSDEKSNPTARPWWITAMAVGCALTVVATMFGDFFIPEATNTEVWFGFELKGAAARATAPLHWIFFALCAWGFWNCKPWVVPVAVLYAFYAALSHVVWSEVGANGRGWPVGVLQALAISTVGLLLHRAGRGLPPNS